MSNEEFDGRASSDTEYLCHKKSRGPALGTDIALLPQGQLLDVEFNEYGQPCSDSTTKLGTWIGITARKTDLLPLSYPDWRKIPRQNIDDAVQKIYDKFNLPKDCRSFIRLKLSERWREFKHEMKSNLFKKFRTREEMMMNLDDCVPVEQWNILIDAWSQESNQKIAARNSNHRANRKYVHTTGKIPFAVIRERKRKEHPEGLNPSRMEMFELANSNKNGVVVNPIAAEKINEMKNQMNTEPEAMRGDINVVDRVFENVVGPDTHGRARLYGSGVTPKDIHGTPTERIASITSQNQSLQNTINQQNSINLELQSKIDMLMEFMNEFRASGHNHS